MKNSLERVKTPPTGTIATTTASSGQKPRGGLRIHIGQRKKRTTEGMSFRRSPSDLQTTRQSAYWIAAAGDGGVVLSSMPLSVAVLCQMVPVVLVPKKRVPVEVETGSAQA